MKIALRRKLIEEFGFKHPDEKIIRIKWSKSGFISNSGKVYCLNRDQELHPVETKIRKNGYHVFTIETKAGGRKSAFIHLTVLMAFVGPKPLQMECCRHLDGNKNNNRKENLKWGTYKENMEDARRHGTLAKGSKNGMAKINETQAWLIKRLLDHGWGPTRIGRVVPASPWMIDDIRKRKTWATV